MEPTMSDTSSAPARLAASIVSAYIAAHETPVADVPGLLSAVRRTLEDLSAGQTPVVGIVPVVNPKASLFRDHIVCLGCGMRVKMLRRHIRTFHGMTPEEYRRHWGLPDSYPMVASAYAKVRSALAKASGLGFHRGASRKRLRPAARSA
jgi:predicted transcriptional regulator